MKKPRILITGADGQVGHELLRSMQPLGELFPTSLVENIGWPTKPLKMDLSSPKSIQQVIREVKPNLIINPAAYTAVDKAESDSDLAIKINGEALAVVAEEANLVGAKVIHYSTDYVFDGSGHEFRAETAETNPLNIYGKSKLAGEKALLEGLDHALVLRTSWVYGVHGLNFVKTMLRLGAERELLKVVDDQIGAPTSARFIADSTALISAKILGSNYERKLHSGVFHLVTAGETSWFGFAEAIFSYARKSGVALKIESLMPIKSSEFPTPAVRPKNSRLLTEKVQNSFNICPPSWEVALATMMESILVR